MARIRTIKPSFWGDDNVSRLTFEARLLAIGLVSMADDQGRFLASTNAISGYVFPHDEVAPTKLRKWLKEIEREGFAVFYSHDGRKYGVLPKWKNHQRISHPQPSPLPAPPPEGLFE